MITLRRKPDHIRLALVVLFCLILFTGYVQAYELTISTPDKVQRGMPLIVNGTSNLPPGISVDIIISKSGYTVEEVGRETVTLQANENFSVVFDTTGFTKGIYKVEVPAVSGYRYLGDSVTLKVVEVIDRSDELRFSAPKIQEMDGDLDIQGSIFGIKNTGVQIEVTGPKDEIVFGPDYISTNIEGSFDIKVPITTEGVYDVSFTDAKGYVGKTSVTVLPKPEPITVSTTVPATPTAMEATATASRDHPAVFSVLTGNDEVRIFTSPGIDWVIEYTDATGAPVKVNARGELDSEEVMLNGTNGVVMVRVYPYKYSVSEQVILNVIGAEKVTSGGSGPVKTTGTTGTTTSITRAAPLPMITAVVALCAGMFLLLRRRL
jgi:hypothetical protein